MECFWFGLIVKFCSQCCYYNWKCMEVQDTCKVFDCQTNVMLLRCSI